VRDTGQALEVRRQVRQGHDVTPGQGHGPFDDVLQFPDVAGVGIGLEHRPGGFVDAGDALGQLVAEAVQEGLAQEGNVFLAFHEAGQGDLHHVEAEVEVLPEAALGQGRQTPGTKQQGGFCPPLVAASMR